MGEFSIGHWLVVAIVVMVLFGSKRLPELGRSLGEGIREFKKAMSHDVTMKPEPKLLEDGTKKVIE